MADENFAAVSPALEQRIRNRIVKQYNRSNVTLDLLPKIQGRGKNLAWDISVGTATGQVFDDGQAVATFNNDTEVLATLPWAEYGDAFKITGRAEDVASGSDTELAELFLWKLTQARERGGVLANTDLWTGAGTAGPQLFFGLTISGGPLDSTGTYAGQSRATFPQWAGNVLANAGVPRAISLSLLEYALEVTFTASGRIPSFGMCGPNLWRLVCELAGGDRRIMQEVYVRGQKLNLSMGFHAVEINGIPIFRDVGVPSGVLALFSEDCIGIEYLPAAPSRIARGKVKARVPFAGTPQEMSQPPALPGAGGTGGPLFANLIELPANGNFDNWQLVATCQPRVTKPNAHVLIKDLNFQAA